MYHTGEVAIRVSIYHELTKSCQAVDRWDVVENALACLAPIAGHSVETRDVVLRTDPHVTARIKQLMSCGLLAPTNWKLMALSMELLTEVVQFDPLPTLPMSPMMWPHFWRLSYGSRPRSHKPR